MPIDLAAVGRTSGPNPIRWNARDSIIYSLGVGAGSADPVAELAFTTENTTGVPQQVLPTFSMVVNSRGAPIPIGEFDRTRSVHGEQSLVQYEPLDPNGEGVSISSVEAIHDKGSGALVVRQTVLKATDGRLLATYRTGQFIRGEGGFGGDPGPKLDWSAPDREPDRTIEQQTRADQALLYRLSGDRNPIHTDPAMARRAGFAKPILHGMCTFGFVGRAILSLADHDPGRFRSMRARFSAPVLPGETLRTLFWTDGDVLRFRTYVGERVVLDAGEAKIR